jgi:HEXXH motif-containing protein
VAAISSAPSSVQPQGGRGSPLFLPTSASLAQSLDARMRASLADSLLHLRDVAASATGSAFFDLAPTLSEIRGHRILPGIFGRYFDLVFALQKSQYSEAAKLFREIAELAVEEPGLAVLPFSDEALRNDVERYGRLLSLESGSWPVLAPPKQAEWDLFQRNVAAALSLIEETDGALASEFYALVTQIVGMGAPQKSDGYGYAGVSSFMLWGAIMLSIRQHGTVLDMIAGLVHEAAHLLLFGLSVDNPFVENAVHERFSSPLRIDPRPMDGVFHATFVCARMHYAFARLLRASATLSQPLETALIERRVADCRSGFFDGYETVQRFGRLTANGQVILTAAAEYMQTPEQ